MKGDDRLACRVCLLTRSWVADDARVRRHGDALVEAGYDVVAVGYRGARAAGPSWHVVETDPAPPPSPRRKLSRSWPALVSRLGTGPALKAFWRSTEGRAFWAGASEVKADLYVAHDWPTLPVAERLARENGGRYVYDSREYGRGEFVQRRTWAVLFPGYVSLIEREYVPGAAAVYTVGDGIAELLRRDLDLPRRPAIVRNVPRFQPLDSSAARRATSTPIRLLYHGMLTPDRGLEQLIDSAILWSPGRTLTVRGTGPDHFVRSLDRRIAAKGLGDRVRLSPPVPPSDLVSAASSFDVGVITYPATTAQLRLALPNKFFEYVMAGLAVLTTDLDEMVSLVRSLGIGVSARAATPQAIAEAVNALEPAAVDVFRAAARAAAPTLSWATESHRLLDVFEPWRTVPVSP